MNPEIEALRCSGKPGRIDEILALPANEILPALSNHIYFVRGAEVSLEKLTPGERIFRLVDEVLLEVNNGGFRQYFDNSAGDNTSQAVSALQKMGATRTASMLQRAAALFGAEGPDANRDRRGEQLERLGEAAFARMESLTGEFFEQDDAAALQLPYVVAHRSDFRDE